MPSESALNRAIDCDYGAVAKLQPISVKQKLHHVKGVQGADMVVSNRSLNKKGFMNERLTQAAEKSQAAQACSTWSAGLERRH